MKENKNKTFNFYGIRETSNPNYYTVTLCAGKDDKREFINVPVKKELVKFSPVDFTYYVRLKPLKEFKGSLNKEKQANKEFKESLNKEFKESLNKDDLPF